MSRAKKVSFSVTAVLVVFLLLMSSTDLIIKEEMEEIKKISVFAVTDEDAGMEDFKRGILEAAGDSRVDANYVTAPGGELKEDLAARLRREYDSGVQAVILFMENPELLRRYVRESGEEVPIITVNAFGSDDHMADVSLDAESGGAELAEEIREKHGQETKTILLTGEEGLSGEIAEVLKKIFRKKKMKAECVELSQENIKRYQEAKEETVFVGCWMTETEQAMELLEGEELYGVGYSNKILDGILEGKVEGVAAFSMYAAGIHATRQAVYAIAHERTENIQIPCRMITKANMKEQQEFLFPVY